jgi:hypothetical protein
MTTSEKTELVLKHGMSAPLIAHIDGLGWSFKDVKYLLVAGVTPGQIESLLSLGAVYNDIKLIVEEDAKQRKMDKIEQALFGHRQPIISNLPAMKDNPLLKIPAQMAEGALHYTGLLIFKLGRKIFSK